jgi:hypothetical protein
MDHGDNKQGCEAIRSGHQAYSKMWCIEHTSSCAWDGEG